MIRGMSETLMTCPQCGNEFDVSEALSTSARAEVELRLAADYNKRLESAVKKAETRANETLGLEMKDLRAQLIEQQRKDRKSTRLNSSHRL